MIRPRLYLFNTNTGRWHQLQNYLLWNHLLKAKPKRRVHGGVCGFTGIKLSNVGNSYLWNITSDICRMGNVWIWLFTTNKVCSSHSVLSVRVFFIQSLMIDHKHGKMLSDHRNIAGTSREKNRHRYSGVPVVGPPGFFSSHRQTTVSGRSNQRIWPYCLEVLWSRYQVLRWRYVS